MCKVRISPAAFSFTFLSRFLLSVSFFFYSLISTLHFFFSISFIFDCPVLTPCPPVTLMSFQICGHSSSENRGPLGFQCCDQTTNNKVLIPAIYFSGMWEENGGYFQGNSGILNTTACSYKSH